MTYFAIFVSAVQVDFKHFPVLTEACNLSERILIFIEHTDQQTYIESCHKITLRGALFLHNSPQSFFHQG